MARTEAQKEWRKENKRPSIRIELTEETKAKWDEYAAQMGIPTGRMVRMCVERCIAEDSGGTWTENEQTETATGNGAVQ